MMSLLFNSVYHLFRYSISAKVTKIIEKLSFFIEIFYPFNLFFVLLHHQLNEEEV